MVRDGQWGKFVGCDVVRAGYGGVGWWFACFGWDGEGGRFFDWLSVGV